MADASAQSEARPAPFWVASATAVLSKRRGLTVERVVA
jgi:hypothetical protein